MNNILMQLSYAPATLVVCILLIPITTLWFGLTRFTTGAGWLLATLVVSLYAVWAYFFIYWYVLSVYLRWTPVVLFLIAAAVSFFRRVPGSTKAQIPPAGWIGVGVLGILVVILGILDGFVIRGQFPNTKTVELEFPLRDGRFVVAHGGSSFLINYHVAVDAYVRYAMDIMQLDGLGRRADGILPPNLSDYVIFGQDVHSPCAGKVIVISDGVPDSPVFGGNPDHPGGNHVAIACDAEPVAVWLVHLEKGSIPVIVGQAVQTGDLLGMVGSSGNSSEPHLHLVAQEYKNGSFGPGVAITFKGRFLARNSVYSQP